MNDTWVSNFFNKAMTVQYNVLSEFPEEKKKAGYGRSAKLVIEGPEGGVFDLWFCDQGVKPKPEGVVTKNIVKMTDETLLNLITPDVSFDKLLKLVESVGLEKAALRLYPRLSFRTALANDLVTISGDKSDVDSEEWSVIIETVLLKIAFPIVIRGMLKKSRV